MRSYLAILLVPIVLLAPVIRPARAEDEKDISAEEVRQTIERGVKFLKSQQDLKKGSWTDRPLYNGGLTPLCTLALLNAGCGPDDEAVSKALAYLRTVRPSTTYNCALQTMVFCAAEPKKDQHLILRNAKWLEDQQIREGPGTGMWSYPMPGRASRGDNSNTQFALLGLYEAERAGVHISDKTWRLALTHWQKSQNPEGSWGYEPSHPGTGSMTCAGIASVIIAAGELSSGDVMVRGDQVDCCSEQQPNEYVERALNWLDHHFSVHRNPGTQWWLFYYLYGIERTGRMTARRFIGQHDWYREGARMLVQSQLDTGAWPDLNRMEADPIVSTSFALIFLGKGRRPVIMAHLKHGPDNDWNHHRGALFNLVSYVEKTWHRDLTYQIIDPRPASVENLLETPVLYISGRDAPVFTDEVKQKLRMYVDRGGFIFAEQTCGGGDFDEGFRRLMKELFPEPESKLHLLPLDHPVWYAEERVDPKYIRELWGIDAGCRTSVVYCPQDLSCFWELARVGREQKYSEPVQAEIKAAEGIGINVLAYATNREVKFKDPGLPTPHSDPHSDQFDRGKLYLANVLHPGGCNAAPGALANLARLVSHKLEIRTNENATPEVRLTDPALFQYHLVFLHGRTAFRLTPAERKQLRAYVERGGMVFADSICSSKQFTESFRSEMKEIFPENPLERIPIQQPLFTAQYGGDDITSVSRRQPEQGKAREPLKVAVRTGEPYLEGVKLDDRYAVIFSPYDVSCALESHESLECEGYTRQDAARIAINVLLYSLHQ